MPAPAPAADVLARIDAWLAIDPDPTTRTATQDLMHRAADEPDAAAELADAFTGHLTFGTAGLRGRMGAGPNRMNRLVVMHAALGLARYLTERHADGGSHRRETGRRDGDARAAAVDTAPAVVVGFDARHGSEQFALDTCAAMAAAGVTAHLMPHATPTPVLAFAIQRLDCDAGVMVTASHNPREDNGYKVYLGDGSQIAPPVDAAIAAQIDLARAAGAVELADSGWQVLTGDLVEDYVAAAAALADPAGHRDLRVAYTPLHGVGREVLESVFNRAGFATPVVVSAQAEPDPDFPGIAFPNPEEPGALDAVMELAESCGADLVLANDPDADRCAVGAKGSAGWRMLTGDEVGTLLAAHLIQRGVAGTFATTIVSSTWMARVCAAHEVPSALTLTGFKWLTKVPELAYAYEEALGYCVAPSLVRDKDGVTAALLVAEMAAAARSEGRSLLDELDALAVQHGLHVTRQVSMRTADTARIAALVQDLAANPPDRIGGHAVTRVADLSQPGSAVPEAGGGTAAGADATDADEGDGSPTLPPTPGVRLMLSGDARIIVRPSGTEPKVKGYLQLVRDAEAASIAAVRAEAGRQIDALGRDLLDILQRRMP
jgi:phosphomannomutase